MEYYTIWRSIAKFNRFVIMTHYLRFPSEESALEQLEQKGFISSGEIITDTHQYSLDVIGTISEGGIFDQETGEEPEPPTLLQGWHVNYIGILPNDWSDYLVFPENPVRKFAGVD